MRTLFWIAIATVSFWIAGELEAQRIGPGIDAGQQAQGQQSDQQEGRRGKRSRRSNRDSGAQQKGRRNAQKDQEQRGRGDGAQMLDFIFKRFDTDQNGSLTIEEAPERMQKRFDALDANGDKSVSKDEMKAAFEKMQGKAGGKGARGAKGQGGKKDAAKGKGQAGGNKKTNRGDRGGKNVDSAQLMQRMDKNKDGLLSPDEAPERMKKNFDRIDADSSGTISTDELKAMFDKLKNGKKQIGRDKSADPNAIKPKRPPMAKDGA